MPLIVSGPGRREGSVRDELISGVDIAPASLARAGIEIPAAMEGIDFVAQGRFVPIHAIAARDRCDQTIERIRAVITPRFKYLRNYLTDRSFMQPSYKDSWPVSKEFRRMMAAGEMNEAQLVFFGPEKPAEELYDLDNDPHEIHNLAADPAFAEELERHRQLLARWIEATGDQGQAVESDIGLLSTLKRWGDQCVNPEYDRVRDQYEAWLKEQPQSKAGKK
jgi:arylsulfatase A-like enzyme